MRTGERKDELDLCPVTSWGKMNTPPWVPPVQQVVYQHISHSNYHWQRSLPMRIVHCVILYFVDTPEVSF